MTYYFGFIPSDKLNTMIDDAEKIITSNEPVAYYPYRNALTQQLACELIDTLLMNLIAVIPNAERQASMKKIANTVQRATETMLNVLLGEDKNEDVIPSFHFLKNESIFMDNDGVRRVGFALSTASAETIIQGFESVTPETIDKVKFKNALETMNEEILTHFISRFTGTLKLGLIKRKAIPIAKAAIDKGTSLALNKLLPQLDNKGLNRLARFYQPCFIKISK